ncbi:hypothetical protein ACFU99_32570 [Streptomyces sp. NPDC057654]|uniref:hypothetical protein n=1 Tax=Streptomyces sp. NPDC057654 TaxID=3346196 RepID=UPI0036B9BE39
MSGGDGLKAGKEALDNISKGLDGAIGELKKVGSPGDAAVGRGFSELALSGLEAGHEDLTSSFKSFCDRWEWGVRALVRDGNEFAHRVGLAAGYYHETDEYISNTLKVTTNAVMGNPHLTEEQVEQQSWGETLSDNPYTQVRDADYSVKSFQDAAGNAKETWSRTADDVQSGWGLGPVGPAAHVVSKIEDYG